MNVQYSPHTDFVTYAFICFTNSHSEQSFHFSNYAIQTATEVNPQKEHCGSRRPSIHPQLDWSQSPHQRDAAPFCSNSGLILFLKGTLPVPEILLMMPSPIMGTLSSSHMISTYSRIIEGTCLGPHLSQQRVVVFLMLFPAHECKTVLCFLPCQVLHTNSRWCGPHRHTSRCGRL